MKTDNDGLFEYSRESFVEYGYKIIEENTDFFDVCTTEYEDKFIGLGKNINYIRVEKE
jgi:tRNA G46 methylase TrmB